MKCEFTFLIKPKTSSMSKGQVLIKILLEIMDGHETLKVMSCMPLIILDYYEMGWIGMENDKRN
jgi:hypothetical protein